MFFYNTLPYSVSFDFTLPERGPMQLSIGAFSFVKFNVNLSSAEKEFLVAQLEQFRIYNVGDNKKGAAIFYSEKEVSQSTLEAFINRTADNLKVQNGELQKDLEKEAKKDLLGKLEASNLKETADNLDASKASTVRKVGPLKEE